MLTSLRSIGIFIEDVILSQRFASGSKMRKLMLPVPASGLLA